MLSRFELRVSVYSYRSTLTVAAPVIKLSVLLTPNDYSEVKHLKQLVRDIIDPTCDLGHVDRHNKTTTAKPLESQETSQGKTSSKDGTGDKTIPLDPDAGVIRGPPADENVGRREEGKDPECEDCK